jgi:DNA helicase HerA-like ATPase
MTQPNAPIASLGSPSSTDEMSLDILRDAASRKLVGSLFYCDLVQEGRQLRVTSQVTGLEMRNSYHEQTSVKNAIKTRGSITGISGILDILTASTAPGAVFGRDDTRDMWSFDVLASIPPSGTPFYRMTQEILDELVEAEKEDIFQIGRAYGDDSVALPMLVKHFGNPVTGGLAEAIHSLLVGKTGAGKSTLAKMILMGYARHKEMAILIIDPKGEFADEIDGYEVGSSGLPMRGVLKGMNRATRRFGITQIKLEGYELFEEVMNALGLDRDLNIRGVDNKEELAKAIVEIIKKSATMKLEDLRGREKLTSILEAIRGAEVEDEDDDGYLSQIYKSKEPKDALRKQINRILESKDHRIFGTWDFLGYLFEKGDGSRPTISQLVRQVMSSKAGERPLAVIDLSVPGNRRDFNDLGDEFEALKDANDERELFTDAIQKKILYKIASDLRRTCENIVAERVREGNRDNVNTVVVFEEAHRFAPRHIASDDEDGKKLKAKLIEAVRETRKFGLGWFFIDQTVGGLDKEITQQVRSFYCGFGLSMGEELAAVKDLIGGDPRDLALYRSFRDPASFGKSGQKKFPWMCCGPVSPMAANRPLFFNAFGGEEFVERNGLPVDRTDRPMRLARLTTKASRSKATNVKAFSLEELDESFL